MASGFDIRAWVVWVIAGSVAAMVARNPAYTLIILLAARLVQSRWARPEQTFALPFGKLVVLVLVISAFFNLAFVHIGETVVGHLPVGWTLIGGPLTVEAAVAGIVNGLIILALLALFLAFNSIVRTGDLVRLVPRAFHDLSVVLLIALTFVPETSRHWQRIREAQAIRGHRLRGWRDFRPLIVPLFVGGFERALTLSETLVARGFNAPAGQALPNWRRGLFLLALVLGLLGWGVTFWYGWLGWLLFAVALLLLILILWQTGQRVTHTVYQARYWQKQDTLMVGIGIVVILLVLILNNDLIYTPYPRISLPPFEPLMGLALSLLAYPAIVTNKR